MTNFDYLVYTCVTKYRSNAKAAILEFKLDSFEFPTLFQFCLSEIQEDPDLSKKKDYVIKDGSFGITPIFSYTGLHHSTNKQRSDLLSIIVCLLLLEAAAAPAIKYEWSLSNVC